MFAYKNSKNDKLTLKPTVIKDEPNEYKQVVIPLSISPKEPLRSTHHIGQTNHLSDSFSALCDHRHNIFGSVKTRWVPTNCTSHSLCKNIVIKRVTNPQSSTSKKIKAKWITKS